MENGRVLPKSLRHKRILDTAAENPGASIEVIADEVPSATAELVENVLDQYGDPGEQPSDENSNETSATDDGKTNENESGSLPDLTEAQRETLRLVYENPEATQREIADSLGVTAPTICNRINDITGVTWESRQEIAEAIFKEAEPENEATEQHEVVSTDGAGSPNLQNQLEKRVETLEQQIDKFDSAPTPTLGLDDPELIHKVLRACFESEDISEDEERQILKTFLPN